MRKNIANNKRLKCFLPCLLVLTMITGMWLITHISLTSAYADDTNPENGVVLNKTAEYDTDTGIATITLEAYTTGDKVIKNVTSTTPTDIVMVLDVSRSMNDTKFTGTNTTYLAGLKTAANDFVASVIDKSKNTNNRVAVVCFSSSAAYETGNGASDALKNMDQISEANEVKSAINGLSASGATDPQKGLDYAKNIFDEYPISTDESRNRVVVFFTDGIPGTIEGKWDIESTKRANAAVGVSDTLTNNYGATVYAVGIFSGANGSSAGKAYKSSTSTMDASLVTGYGNYFMQHVSANGTLPQNGISGYYFSAADSGELSSIFTEIAHQVEEGGSTVALKESTIIEDTVSPYFTMPENTDGVTFQIADYIGVGENEWSDPVAAAGVTFSIDGRSLNVGGFNFSENWVGTVTNADGGITYCGKKLIITFKVHVASDYLGGSKTETNGEDSGIYVDGESFGSFVIPTVNVPLKQIDPVSPVEGDDWNVYLTTENELTEKFKDLKFKIGEKELVFADIFNGTNNAHANVSFVLKDSSGNPVNTFTVPAGGTAGSWNVEMPILTDSSYKIECTVDDASGILESKTAEDEITLNLFRPVLTFNDMNVYYGGDMVDLNEVDPSVEWKCGEKSDTNVTMHTSKPTLTYTYSGATEETVDKTTDYTIGVTNIGVKNRDDINLIDVENAVTFLRNCGVEHLNEKTGSKDEAFRIHVYAPALSFTDISAYYGEQVILADYSKNVSWTNKNGTPAPQYMDNNEPTIVVTTAADIGINDARYVTVTNDFSVKAEIKIGDKDVTQTLIDEGKLTRNCDSCQNPEVTVDEAYYVHVKTVSLSVKKLVEGRFADKSGTFSFEVTVKPSADTGLSEITKSLSLTENEEQELADLPKDAEFEITETGIQDEYSVYFSVNGEEKTFSSERKIKGTLSSDSTSVVVTNKVDTIPVTGIDGNTPLHGICIVLFSSIVLIVFRNIKRGKLYKYNDTGLSH